MSGQLAARACGVGFGWDTDGTPGDLTQALLWIFLLGPGNDGLLPAALGSLPIASRTGLECVSFPSPGTGKPPANGEESPFFPSL